MKKKFLAIILIFAVLLIFAGCRAKDLIFRGKVELTYYKLFDEEDVMAPLLAEYEKLHKNVTIRYRKFVNQEEYEDLILNEFAEGEGPDIFEVSNASLPRYFKKISPLYAKDLTPQVFAENFVKVVADDFVKEDSRDGKLKIYGIPFSIDVPVIYYNKKIFESRLPEKGKPSSTWDKLADDVFKLREEDKDGNLKISGIAMGREDNISNAFEILLNLMLQEGVSFYDDNFKKATFSSREGEKAIKFFLSFSDSKNKQYSWNEKIVPSESELKEIEAFLTGKTAMIIGYFDIYPRLEVVLKNLRAKGFSVIGMRDIAIALMAQNTEVPEEKVVFAKYFAQTVSRTSKHPDIAWDLIDFLSSKMAKKYVESSGKPAARRDLIEDQKKDPVLFNFVSQIGFAKSIPMLYEPKYRNLFNDAIRKTVSKELQPSSALQEVQEIINVLLRNKDGLFPKFIPPKKKKKT